MPDTTDTTPSEGEVSRFSKVEAELRGWVFTHDSSEQSDTTSATQGETRVTPARLVAEKWVSLPGTAGQFVTETGESLGKLLERIHAYEQHLTRVGHPSAPIVQQAQEVAQPENPESVMVFKTPANDTGDAVLLRPGETLDQARERQANPASVGNDLTAPSTASLAVSGTSPSPGPAAEAAIAAVEQAAPAADESEVESEPDAQDSSEASEPAPETPDEPAGDAGPTVEVSDQTAPEATSSI